MNQRRSLSQALQTAELPAEALALIREGSPRPLEDRQPAPEPTAVEARAAPARVTRPAPVREAVLPDAESENPAPRGLVSLSVRVNSALADTLLKIAFERKLQRRHPFSQQDIVTQAVNQWLRKNGHSLPED